MKNGSAIGGALLIVAGAAWVKLYGEYKYYCGKVDAGNFYTPIINIMGEQIKDLCEKLKAKEGEA